MAGFRRLGPILDHLMEGSRVSVVTRAAAGGSIRMEMKRNRLSRWSVVLMLWSGLLPGQVPAQTLVDQGYGAMYNLKFAQAHEMFRQWEHLHPDDPIAPASDAAAYLFSEFDRLHVLEMEFFVDDGKYESRQELSPDAAAKQAFEADLARTVDLANRVLARDPANGDALFALALADGLRADYLALIERRDLAALSYVKSGRMTAEKLLTKHPDYYDGYLAVGVENYLLSLKPAPLRWILHLTGAQTDKQAGLEKLRVTAQKGRYLLPYARLLLAVAALRDGDRARGAQLLRWLAQQFPQNHLYSRELAKVEGQAGSVGSGP